MPGNAAITDSPKLNNALVVLATLSVFAAFSVVGHWDSPLYWSRLFGSLSFSAAGLLLVGSRDAFGTFLTAIAVLFTLGAAAMAVRDRANHNWWRFFIGFTGAAAVLVLLTRRRRAALAGIAAVVALRLAIALFAYVFPHQPVEGERPVTHD